MVVTKLGHKEWAHLVERGLRMREVKKTQRQHANTQERFWIFINNHRILPLGIGIIACISVLYIWGWMELLNMLFSWVIGIVVVTTLVAGLLHPGHPNGLKR